MDSPGTSSQAPSGLQNFQTYYNVFRRATLSYESFCLPSFLHISAVPLSIEAPLKSFGPSFQRRLYFVSFPPNTAVGSPFYRCSTLFYVDLPETVDDVSRSAVDLVAEPLLPAIVTSSESESSLAENLLRERMRMEHAGITDLKVDSASGHLVVLVGSKLFHCVDTRCSPRKHLSPTDSPDDFIQSTLIPAQGSLLPAICPLNPNLVVFVCEKDINVASIQEDRQATVINLTNLPNQEALSAGMPAFVIQEEFDRYVGFWWRPYNETPENGRCVTAVYTILYEETDESLVDITYLPRHDGWNQELEPHHYPKPGKHNATSTLKLAKIHVNRSTNVVEDVHILSLPLPLFKLFPDYEYLVRAGWTSTGDFVWVQLMDRLQLNLVLLLIPPENFIDDALVEGVVYWKPIIQLLHEKEDIGLWIETHDCLHFLTPQTSSTVDISSPPVVSFIWLSSRSGYRHLYHYTCEIPATISKCIHFNKHLITEPISQLFPHVAITAVACQQLTSGEWEVLSDQIFVDETRKLVIFEGLREHPLWTNIYAVAFDPASEVVRLSSDVSEARPNETANFSHSVMAYDASSGLLVTTATNHTYLPGFAVYRLVDADDSACIPRLKCIGWLKNHSLLSEAMPVLLQPLAPPKMLTFQFLNGTCALSGLKEPAVNTFYGMLFTPSTPPPTNAGFPTLHMVYGGPGVQLVKGGCSRALFLRAQFYCHCGYAVLLCDCRGSANRGSVFAGHIKYKLGTCELDEHIAFLRRAANETGLIDLKRVAISGNSYGGYMALMAAAGYRETYRAAIAGSPVVDWEHYDTAYTERYLGLPCNNRSVYDASSVLKRAASFPDHSPYLLISHGGQDENVHFAHTSALLQQLDSIGKPYELLYYPASRHGVREMDHLTASIICFLDKTIGPLTCV